MASLLATLALPFAARAQTATGELRVYCRDPQGLALSCAVTLVSDTSQLRKTLQSTSAGEVDARRLPFGTYAVTAEHAGFAPVSTSVAVRSSLPAEYAFTLKPASAESSVLVQAAPTLIDPSRAGDISQIGKQQMESRVGSLPRRGLVDLVGTQPGWVFEGSAVLHPRGSEYQTQFVIDGIPFTEKRSPGWSSEIEASDVQSMSVYTAGIPAEYGRKMGGVVEVNTLRDPRDGLHGTAMLSGGSFLTAESYLSGEYGWGKNSAGLSADGAYTHWFENPPVLQNFTNRATDGDLAGQYERDFRQSDRLTLTARHEFARFLVPNEQVQQAAGQREHRDTMQTSGTAAWQHIFSAHALANLNGMARDDTTHLTANAASTPIIPGQDRGYREGYLKGSGTLDRRRNEWKAGFETDFVNLHEGLSYILTDPSQFDPGTPAAFDFFARGRDREQALFLEDSVHFRHWNLAAGLRWDHYALIVHQSAFSPRLAVSHEFARPQVLVHVAYDRVFQTPAFENILLSSSPAVVSLNPEVLRKPVGLSHGNYYEAGAAKVLGGAVRVDGNVFLRRVNNFADDNPLLDTAISFPISFRKASIYGAEGKLEVPHWNGVSGYLSYSYTVGSAYLPVTGGLFLGDDATQALQARNGRFWVSQDQRNTANTRWMYHLPRGVWLGAGAEYVSGLPVEFDASEADAIAQYGQALVNRVNFARRRVQPSLAVNLSCGIQVIQRDQKTMRMQADAENVNNRINLIDFAGLFSGNAVAPPRSYDVRLTFDF